LLPVRLLCKNSFNLHGNFIASGFPESEQKIYDEEVFS